MREVCELSKEKCKPCSGDELPMGMEEAMSLLKNLHEGWSINQRGHLERTYLKKGFLPLMELANKMSHLAESEGHHPDFYITWGKLIVEVWTHKIKGLSRADFVLAAKIDEI